jgi:uncharacterized protein (DUF1015 family)
MPKIKPFRGIRPSQEYVDRVVLSVENLSLSEAKKIRSSNPYSYLNMLVPKLGNSFLRGTKQEITYKKIHENFEDFIERGILVQDDRPAIYIYQVADEHFIQTGIWTSTSIDDYLSNTIKKHELTRADREKALIDYLQETGMDANPVLITYLPQSQIQAIISNVIATKSDLHFVLDRLTHQLWKVDQPDQLAALSKAFEAIPASYIADGHHRAAAASVLGIQRRKLNLKHTGNESYNFFNSVYMSTDQLRIFEFNRLVKDIGSLSVDQLIRQLSVHFEIERLSGFAAFKPQQLHEFGMYVDHCWYRLRAKPDIYEQKDVVDGLDVSLLQDYILSPILQITDPRTDSRLTFVGGMVPTQTSIEQVDQGDNTLLFTLFPIAIEQLIQVADAGEVMPPKSTWVVPKFQVGLVIHSL